MKLFEPESGFMAALEHFISMICVGLLCLICSLPLITAGAAYSAAYHTMVRTVRGGRGYLFREYFRTFGKKFGQATAVWLIYAAAAVIISIDRRIFSSYTSRTAAALNMVLLVILILLTAVVVYALSYLVDFPQKISVVIRNSVLISLRHFPWTVFIGAVIALCAYLGYSRWYLMIILPGPVIMLFSFILERIFSGYVSGGQ